MSSTFEQNFPTVAKYLTTFGPCAHPEHEDQYSTEDKSSLYQALQDTENGTRKFHLFTLLFITYFSNNFISISDV